MSDSVHNARDTAADPMLMRDYYPTLVRVAHEALLLNRSCDLRLKAESVVDAQLSSVSAALNRARWQGRATAAEDMTAYGLTRTNRLTTEAVASLLGVRPSTVRSYAARGQMPRPDPCPCCGHGATWDRQQIIDWHEGRPSQTDQPRSQP